LPNGWSWRRSGRGCIWTAQALDDEMRAKIDRHRAARGAGWRTIEAPLDLPAALSQAGAADIVLLDCATLWLSNHLLADHDPERECSGLMHALAACPAPVVVVSNEIGMSPVPQNAMARIFGQAQGALNRQLAAQAGLVVAVMAGLPLTLKGTLPAGVA